MAADKSLSPASLLDGELKQVEDLILRLASFPPKLRQYAAVQLLATLGGPGFTQSGKANKGQRGRRQIDFQPLWAEHIRRLKSGEACELIAHEAKALREYQANTLGISPPLSINSITRRVLERHGHLLQASDYTARVKSFQQNHF